MQRSKSRFIKYQRTSPLICCPGISLSSKSQLHASHPLSEKAWRTIPENSQATRTLGFLFMLFDFPDYTSSPVCGLLWRTAEPLVSFFDSLLSSGRIPSTAQWNRPYWRSSRYPTFPDDLSKAIFCADSVVFSYHLISSVCLNRGW